MQYAQNPSAHDRLRFGSRTVSRELAEQDPQEWARLLESIRLCRSQAWCLCHGELQTLPMFVARHGNTLALKRAPGSGPKHHPYCPSYADEGQSSGGSNITHPAIERTADGGLRVRLDVPLRTLKTPGLASGSPTDRRQERPGQTRNTLTLLGLLELLWERARLHRWHPEAGPRRLGAVYRKLIEESSEIAVGSTAASDALYIPDTRLDEASMHRKAADIGERLRTLGSACKPGETPVLLIVGEVRSLFDARYGSGLRLKGLPDAATVWMTRELAGDVARRFEAPVNRFLAGKEYAGRLICITGVQLSSKGLLNATTCSLMETNADFIPVDSQHEARLADLLVAQGASRHA